MSKSINKVILVGRVGADPEMHYTGAGTAVVTLSVATNSRIKRDDEWIDQTEWHRVTLWDALAKIASEYLTKGREIYVEGRLQTRSYEKTPGQKLYTTEIIASELLMLGGKPASAQV